MEDGLKRFTEVLENSKPFIGVNYTELINLSGFRVVQEIIQEIQKTAKERNLSVDDLGLPESVKTKLYDAYAHKKLTLSDLIFIAYKLNVEIHLTIGKEEKE